MRAACLALPALFVLVTLLTVSKASASEAEVRTTITAFLHAFEHGDIEAMEAAFAEDAVTFPRVVMSSLGQSDIDPADYRRVRGIDPQMRALIDAFRAGDRHPPYLQLEPRDLLIQLFGDVAVVTFHLEGSRLARRTFVLAKTGIEWKIVHLHASNVSVEDQDSRPTR